MIDFEISFDRIEKVRILIGAEWSSLVARRAHNPASATKILKPQYENTGVFLCLQFSTNTHRPKVIPFSFTSVFTSHKAPLLLGLGLLSLL